MKEMRAAQIEYKCEECGIIFISRLQAIKHDVYYHYGKTLKEALLPGSTEYYCDQRKVKKFENEEQWRRNIEILADDSEVVLDECFWAGAGWYYVDFVMNTDDDLPNGYKESIVPIGEYYERLEKAAAQLNKKAQWFRQKISAIDNGEAK